MLKRLFDRYYISPLDLADSAETNRLIMLIISPILFLFGAGDIIAILVLHHSNLVEYKIPIIYFSFFAISGLFCYILSRKTKNVSREKAYILKTIPFFTLFYIALSACLYNFYVREQPFNGFVAYFLAGSLSLFLFSFSPYPFLVGLVITQALMTPGLYTNFGVTGTADSVLITIILFGLSLYKRRVEKRNIVFLKKQKQNLEAKTFGNFTLIYENQVVKFNRTKSNELLGYLIYKRGSSVNTKELISALWGDNADSARYGSSLRNLIVDIKHTFNELQIENFFIAEYNSFRINPEVIICDYYNFLSGDPTAINSFAGEFMSQYSWAEEVSGFLEQKALNK